MLIVFCLALAYAIQGAASQAWSDGRRAVADTVQRHRAVTVAARTSDHRGVRAAGYAATVLSWLAGVTWQVAWGTGRSLTRGAVTGWRRGRDIGRARREDLRASRDAKRAERETDGTPSWRHYLTGQCPTCGHPPKASVAETDGCGCGNTDWACPCALRGRSRNRSADVPGPCACCGHSPTATGYDTDGCDCGEWGCPCALRARARSRARLNATTSAGLASWNHRPMHDTTNGATMTTTNSQPITGEAGSIEATRAALEAIVASAANDLDSAHAIYEMAKGRSVAAEQMLADLTTADLDGQTLADITTVQESAAAQETDAQRQLASCEATHGAAQSALAGLNERHSGVEEAVNATAHAARTDWYRG